MRREVRGSGGEVLSRIPEIIRGELRVGPRTYLSTQTHETEMHVTPIGDDPVDAAYGMFAHLGPLRQGFLEYKREERELEERKEGWLEKTLFRKSSSTPSR